MYIHVENHTLNLFDFLLVGNVSLETETPRRTATRRSFVLAYGIERLVGLG